MTFFKEHRLIHLRYDQFEDQTRYNKRTASANASAQEQQHQQAMASKTGQVQTYIGSDGQDTRTYDENNRPIAGTGTLSTQQTTGPVGPQGYQYQVDPKEPLVDEYGNPTQAGILSQARTVYNNDGESYDPQTGQTTITSNNPRASGNQASAARPTTPYTQDTDAASRASRLGLVDTSTLTRGSNAGVQEDPTAFAQRVAAVEAQNTEKLNQQSIIQKQENDRASRNANSSAMSQEKAQTPQQTALDAAIASLPPEYAVLGEALKADMAAASEEKKNAAANMKDEYAAADASNSAYGKVLDKAEADSKYLQKKGEDFVQQSQEAREKSLAAQQASTIEQLKWQENKIARDQRRALDKRVNSMIAAQAVGGGFGSSNWTAEVAEAEWQGEEAILDMQKEFGFKRADVDIAYTEQLNGIYEFYGREKLTALKEHKAEIGQINQFRFSAAEKTEERKTKARENFRATLTQSAKDQAAAINKASDKVLAVQSEIRAEKRAEEKQMKADAWSMFNFAFSESTDPAMRRKAVSAMAKAGYDVSGVDVNALPVSMQSQLAGFAQQERMAKVNFGYDAILKSMDNAKKQDESDLYDAYRYTQPEDQRLMSDAINAVTGLTGADATLRAAHLKKVAHQLDSGNRKGAEEEVRGIASLKLKGEAPEFAARAAINKESADIQGMLTVLNERGEVRGLYAQKISDLNKYANKSQDPDYLDVSTRISNVTAEVIKERYGAALTDNELKEMERYMPRSNDTVLDAMGKLRNLDRALRAKNDAMIDTLIGRTGAATTPMYQSEETYDNSSVEDMLYGDEPIGGGETVSPTAALMRFGKGLSQNFNTVIKSREEGGLYDSSTVAAWEGRHAGLDIKIPQGTKIPIPVSGEVIEAGYVPGWGGTAVVREPNGAEHRLAHLQDIGGLKPGMKIQANQFAVITGGAKGTKGAGNSTGPHLDYRISVGGKYVDPLTYHS